MIYTYKFILIVLVGLILPADAFAQEGLTAEAETLTLKAAYELAIRNNPRLEAARHMVMMRESQEEPAGLPADPTVQLGVMNLEIPGLRASMPGSMVPSVSIMQTLPFPGILRLRRTVAENETQIARLNLEALWWNTRTDIAASYYQVYEAQSKLSLLVESLKVFNSFWEISQALYATGRAQQSDVLKASVEVSKLQAEISREEKVLKVEKARLRGLLGLEQEVRLKVADIPDYGTFQKRFYVESAPRVESERTLVAKSRTLLEIEKKNLLPSITIGAQYGRQPKEGADAHMGGVSIGLTVPVFAHRKQMKELSGARALVRAREAELQHEILEIRAELEAELAELEYTEELRDLYENEILVQAETNVESALTAYQAGAVNFLTLLDAQLTLLDHQKEFYGLLAKHGIIITQIENLLGTEIQFEDKLNTGGTNHE